MKRVRKLTKPKRARKEKKEKVPETEIFTLIDALYQQRI